MKKVIIIFGLLVGFVYAGDSRPVMVSGGGDNGGYMLCYELYSIRGIDRHGDGFVAIRNGPGSKYSIKKKFVKNGRRVMGCERVGNWIGILYSNSKLENPLDECDLHRSNYEKPHPYKGSCKTGWIYKKYVSGGLAS